MADFTQIIQKINDDINTNGVEAVTGAKLNEVLRDMIAAVNAEKQDPLTIDATPTEDSTNPVQSGGVEEALGSLYRALFVAENCLFGGLVTRLESPSQGDDHRYYYITKQGGYFSHFDVTIPDDTPMAVMIYWSDILSRWATIGLWPTMTYVDAKANKVSGATQGNLASLDSEGNPTDSGIAASDVATTSDLAGKQDTISDLSTIRSGAAAGATAYQKPSGGIPKTDLASGVQTSLGKADTAVQQVTVGTTTTGNAGTNASVTNSGTITAPVLNFTIPRGDKGDKGDNGQGITYKNADDVSDLPTPSSSQSAYIYLIPSTTEQGVVDQYACIENAIVEGQVVSGWSWVFIGTTAPIVSVQEVDVFATLPPITIHDGKMVNAASGALDNVSTSLAFEFDIKDVITLKVSCKTTMGGASTRYTISFYDEVGYMGESYSLYQLANGVATTLTDALVTPPQGATRMIVIQSKNEQTTTGGTKCVVIGSQSISQSLIKKQIVANSYYYGTVTITDSQDMNISVENNTEILGSTKQSAFGFMFPNTYRNTGKPTQVIAMLHGSSGCVTPSIFGYDALVPTWETWRNQYLAAGFAVLDINGYGVSNGNDRYSVPCGNPQSVETLDKAFEYLRLTYNISDKLLLHGTSMGGANAMAYLMNHPNKVQAVALFAPALIMGGICGIGISPWSSNYYYLAWGYESNNAMKADNFSHLVGYAPMLEDDFDWANMDTESYQLLTSKTKLPNVPIRVWQGTEDVNVPYLQTSKLVECLRRSNLPVTLRAMTNVSHDQVSGHVDYVRNEAVSWFKRFVN